MERCFNPFAPKPIDSLELNQIITQQKTPEEVLQNFKYAYAFRDSVLYSNLLDSSFVFIFFNPNYGTSGIDENWTRDDDLRTTGRLFRNFNVKRDITWNNTIYKFQDDSLGVAEIAKSFHLNLISDDVIRNITGNAIFTFRRSPQDSVWRITRWKDNSNY